ncbi:MAG: lysylphosphatidylglycerol synthase transmembrane domain-containing protein, partial [Roseiflexaceae bacterium]
MRSQITRWLLRIIGPLLFIVFLWRTDLSLLWKALANVDWWPVALSLALMPFFIIVKAWRWQVIMRELGLTPPDVWQLSRIYTIGLFLGGTTPGQSGDFAKALYLRAPHRPMPSLLFSIFVERLCDVAAMAVLAFIGLAALADTLDAASKATIQQTTITVAVIIFAMLPVLLIRRSRNILFGVLRMAVPRRWHTRYDGITQQFDALNISATSAAVLVLSTSLSGLSTAIRIALLFTAMALTAIPLAAVLGSTGQIALLQALPISVSGIGI